MSKQKTANENRVRSGRDGVISNFTFFLLQRGTLEVQVRSPHMLVLEAKYTTKL